MNKQSREALDAYYVEADSWAKDRQDALRASRRIAWMVAAAAAAIAVLEAIALVVLMPLKRVEPYTLLVDRHTGFVQALNPLEPQRISADTALTQSFLVQYVIARESFDISTLQGNYRKVALWSAQSARANYIAGMQASNPDSPLVRLPRTAIVETTVRSVSPVARNVAMVRFVTQRLDENGRAQPPQAWVAMIRYRFSGAPMRMEDRFVNPLGFEVLRYRRDAEAVPVVADPPPRAALTGSNPPGSVAAPNASVPAPAPSTETPPAQPVQPEVTL
jgi:type IV secretion system protein VirB8